jgi:hypothetical protein
MFPINTLKNLCKLSEIVEIGLTNGEEVLGQLISCSDDFIFLHVIAPDYFTYDGFSVINGNDIVCIEWDGETFIKYKLWKEKNTEEVKIPEMNLDSWSDIVTSLRQNFLYQTYYTHEGNIICAKSIVEDGWIVGEVVTDSGKRGNRIAFRVDDILMIESGGVYENKLAGH